MVENKVYVAIVPEHPRISPKEEMVVYVPVASIDKPGIAKFNKEQFEISSSGSVKLSNEYIKSVLLKDSAIKLPYPGGSDEYAYVLVSDKDVKAVKLSKGFEPKSIVLRDENGFVKVQSPKSANDAVPKQYVDNVGIKVINISNDLSETGKLLQDVNSRTVKLEEHIDMSAETVDIVQVRGTDSTKVMSQKSTSENLDKIERSTDGRFNELEESVFETFYTLFGAAAKGDIIVVDEALAYVDGDRIVFIKCVDDGDTVGFTPLFSSPSSLSYSYSTNGDYCIVTGRGSVIGSEIVIPATYRDKPVLKVARDAFKNDASINKIIFGANIIYIGEGNLETLPNLNDVRFEIVFNKQVAEYNGIDLSDYNNYFVSYVMNSSYTEAIITELATIDGNGEVSSTRNISDINMINPIRYAIERVNDDKKNYPEYGPYDYDIILSLLA